MTLVFLIAILLGGGVLAWLAARWSETASRWVALVATLADLVIGLVLWARHYGALQLTGRGSAWVEEVSWDWIPRFGVRFHLALDGLSLLMLLLTFFLGVISVLVSWTEIRKAVGFFHLNLLWVLGGIVGVFLALDLFLFYFAWELMLVPMYFLIAVWGHERRIYAAVKFFIFTQVSGLLMLVAILALYFFHHQASGVYTFEYEQLLGTPLAADTAMWIMLGFFFAFAVKLPMVPFHTWLPDAHTEAPTAGSVILAGLLLKTGAYGLLRFVVPLFPEAAARFAPVAMTLAVVGILYGGLLALGQNDFKRLVAYTSVAHLGFVLLGIFAWNDLALQGALVTMVAHGISTGALFAVAGLLQERIHTRDMGRMSGLWATAPALGGVTLFFALGSLGLPGLADFVGEFLVLLGSFQVNLVLTAFATVGVLVATFYALRLVQRAFQGPNLHDWKLPDLAPREALVFAPMVLVLLWIGLYPRPLLRTFDGSMKALQEHAARGTGRGGEVAP